MVVVVVVIIVVTVEISSGLILSYEIRFCASAKLSLVILEVYKPNAVFLFRMSLLVYSGITV